MEEDALATSEEIERTLAEAARNQEQISQQLEASGNSRGALDAMTHANILMLQARVTRLERRLAELEQSSGRIS
jgi:polyhydroxyalkanoate synthesis regulator phasin